MHNVPIIHRRKRQWIPPKQTRPTTRYLHSVAVRQLLAAGINPHVYRNQRNADGTVSYRPFVISKIDDKAGSAVDFTSTKSFSSLPLVDKRRRQAIELPLRYYCQQRPNVYWGVARVSAPRPAAFIAEERRQLFSRLVDTFELGKRDYGVDLLFAIAHEPVKTRLGTIRKDSTGQLLYGIHAHFLFLASEDDSKLTKFVRYFEKKFPIASRIGKVWSKQRKISYILTRPDYETILAEKQFVDYHKGVGSTARIRNYGKFKAKLHRHKIHGVQVLEHRVTFPSGIEKIKYAVTAGFDQRRRRSHLGNSVESPSITAPNTLLFKTKTTLAHGGKVSHSYIGNRIP